jgi:hypothetical protein
MKPKDILTLLEIVDLSSQSPAYSAITGAAHKALIEAQLHVIGSDDDDEEESHSSPPPRAPSAPPLPPRRT